MSIFRCLGNTKYQSKSEAFYIASKVIRFYGDELLATHPNPKLEDHPLSGVHNCSFNIFAATLHIAGRSSTANLRTRLAVVTETNLSACMAIIKHCGKG